MHAAARCFPHIINNQWPDHALKRGRSEHSCTLLFIDARTVLRVQFMHVLVIVARTSTLHGVFSHVNNTFILLRLLTN